MGKRYLIMLFIGMVMFSSFISAATLMGSVYNSGLELEKDVILEIDTTPQQKYISKDGKYSFEIPPGKYVLTTKSSLYTVLEEVEITSNDGEFIFDVLLLPDFIEEDELWEETENEIPIDDGEQENRRLSYFIAAIIVLFSVYRIIKARKKYGPLKIFRRKVKAESKKSIEQHKEELEKEPGYLDKAVEIIQKHEGRITQKELRKEMLYLSEAKVSLIITELEHKGKIEKIKKGRGNVIILK